MIIDCAHAWFLSSCRYTILCMSTLIYTPTGGMKVTGCTIRLVSLLATIPATSLISTPLGSIPLGSFQFASSMFASPRLMPGHIRQPAPNGINSKFVPLKSRLLVSNRSGLNSSGSSQYEGSLPIAHTKIVKKNWIHYKKYVDLWRLNFVISLKNCYKTISVMLSNFVLYWASQITTRNVLSEIITNCLIHDVLKPS